MNDTHLAPANDDMDLDNSRSKPKVMGVVSPNNEFEEGEFKVKKDNTLSSSELCVRENNTDAQVSIRQLLDTGESSVGAQHRRIIRDEEDGEKLCAMDNNIIQLSQSSTLTTLPSIATSVKPPSLARVHNCLTVCRREEVITRCDSDQKPTRCASSAGQCSNVRRFRLYPRRPCIQWQLSPISERDECSDNITTSLEVSKNDTETSGNSVQYSILVLDDNAIL